MAVEFYTKNKLLFYTASFDIIKLITKEDFHYDDR